MAGEVRGDENEGFEGKHIAILFERSMYQNAVMQDEEGTENTLECSGFGGNSLREIDEPLRQCVFEAPQEQLAKEGCEVLQKVLERRKEVFALFLGSRANWK